MASTEATVNAFQSRGYKEGFYTDIEAETFEPGLTEDTVRKLSAIKSEPEWMTEWRLKALRKWQDMQNPDWAFTVASVEADSLQ